jgi:hypothetical protein
LEDHPAKTYPDFSDLIFVDGDVGTKDRYGDLLRIGHSRVAPILILRGDREGWQALGTDPWAVSCGQHIVAGALEVKGPAIEGHIVRVSPQPACRTIVGHTHALAILVFACLLRPAGYTMAWI